VSILPAFTVAWTSPAKMGMRNRRSNGATIAEDPASKIIRPTDTVTLPLAIAVAVPVYQDVRERELKAQADADYLLIESVQSQLSRSAPMAMQPLMQLMEPVESAQDSSDADRTKRQ